MSIDFKKSIGLGLSFDLAMFDRDYTLQAAEAVAFATNCLTTKYIQLQGRIDLAFTTYDIHCLSERRS
jgi:hypothetical protein